MAAGQLMSDQTWLTWKGPWKDTAGTLRSCAVGAGRVHARAGGKRKEGSYVGVEASNGTAILEAIRLEKECGGWDRPAKAGAAEDGWQRSMNGCG